MPFRSLSVKVRPSADVVQDLARPGSVCLEMRLTVIKSAVSRPMTSREIASVAVTGFRVLGSERCPMTKWPP